MALIASMSDEQIVELVHNLLKLPTETEHVEFKHNNADPQMIGKDISALSNSAALKGVDQAYMVWGVSDQDHQIVGTDFNPYKAKQGNQNLLLWLQQKIHPSVHFEFHSIVIDGMSMVVLSISSANERPVEFNREAYIRIGSSTTSLRNKTETERMLWRLLDHIPFEKGVATDSFHADSILSQVDYSVYFRTLELPLPAERKAIITVLCKDNLLKPHPSGSYSVTNLGAVLFANNLHDFYGLGRKTVRVIQYEGNGRTQTKREKEFTAGYACDFQPIIDYVMNLLPLNEVIQDSIRRELSMYPEIAIRELVANCLIHQDMLIEGAGPLIELFIDRIEITNPGVPIVSIDRLLDSPPQSRNEGLASLMRRCKICEERGSGVDKVVQSTENYQLPAPEFEEVDGRFTKATLFAHKHFSDMTMDERIRACYLHACLKYVQSEYLTNSSLRDRFRIDPKNSAMISRVIKEAIDANRIKPFDPATTSRKYMKYKPIWA